MSGLRAELVRRLSLGDEVEAIDQSDRIRWRPAGRERAVELEAAEQDLSARIAALVDDDACGAFGPGISAAEAAWKLLTVHLDEVYETMPVRHHLVRITPTGVHSVAG